jgi:hydrogenase maturation protease
VKTLIAGVGNIFFSDDGFGPAAIRLLDGRSLGEDVRVRDFGISGMHLALEMLEPYDRIVLVDALARDDPPGTLCVIEPNTSVASNGATNPHAMNIEAVLTLYAQLRSDMAPSHSPEILIVGCVPQNTDEGMELSEPVRAALPRCVELIAGAVQR